MDLQEFEKLTPIIKGESKDVRELDEHHVAIRFLPTVYSYTHNRCGVIEGTAELRVRATEILVEHVRNAGVDHAYYSFHGDIVVAKRVEVPPVEVIVKGRHIGTPLHRYYGMDQHVTRRGYRIIDRGPYPLPLVRFDWRNPIRHPDTGERLPDEVMADTLANEYLDVPRARTTALRVWTVLTIVFGELSPDCGRFRYEGRALDKDVWRKGGTPEAVLERWQELVKRLEAVG